ncbi:MAG: SusC/RagA family TonB-linked outer membrane protein [Bacteroidales bacterium]|nr:SusC/RagA family TonB-linked outer membrane protein [Bacteroidales bacterium]MCB9013598.1 SusC/RagA family TonB-linked outer membrane protein [Bacteroidales bacterium]
MTKRFTYLTCLSLLLFIGVTLIPQTLRAQTDEITIKGVVSESGTGLPIEQVSISVSSTGVSASTDSTGAFSIVVPNLQAELIVDLPGYNKRNVYLNGRDFINISIVSDKYRSFDNAYNKPLGTGVLKDVTYPLTALTAEDISLSKAASFDQVLQGRVPGLSVIQQSGMPGSRTYMNIRGFSSLYANNEPLLFIDGMIHDYSYASRSLMEGFSMNPFDIVDIDDIADITVLKDGQSYLGAAGSNGVINVNTEQKSETSTVIKFSTYRGISFVPTKQDVLDPDQFRSYFTDVFNTVSPSPGDINSLYPWLNGNSGADYYKYNNNTNWQDEIFKPASLSKYHFFLKGGDDIATYNISTGFLSQKAMYDGSGYSRFNLRINGKINITDKFSVTPNAKLSLADSYLPNQGYSTFKNPIQSALLMPPIMAPYSRDAATGVKLPYIDDTGIFDVSNPVAIVKNAVGTDRNYNFLSSVNAAYAITDKLKISTLLGIDFNNARESIFLPNIGMYQVDSASNSPGDLVNEYRSTQSHTTISYNSHTMNGHSIDFYGGFRYLRNTYKYDKGIDLNTPSDDFRSLGQGSKYNYLRTTTGDDRGLVWVSYFASGKYNYQNKYFADVNLSYDGNSAVNADHRFNFYPSVGAAWRLSSESFLNQAAWLEDLKLRASYSVTGNMFSSIYDYSKLYYTSARIDNYGVLFREAIPNENLELEKKNMVNAGLDLSVAKQAINLHVDYYTSTVNNLIVEQELPESYGYTMYFDNGGKLSSSGIEVAADARIQSGDFAWIIGGTVTQMSTEVKSLEFLNPAATNIVTTIDGAQFVSSVGNPLNSFYGYKTDGIYQTAAEANAVIGPKGLPMQAGDVRFVDSNGDNKINDADKTIIGNPNPSLFGSIYTTFSYKRFDVSLLFNYSMGKDAFNYLRYKTESMDSYDNQSVSVLDRWTASNPSNTMPRAAFGDPTGNTVFSDRWIEDASFLRLQKLTIDYNLAGLPGVYKGITLYITASNLLTFTKYKGYDPDFQYMNSPFYMGVDYGMMPQTRSFIIGAKLDL